MVWSTPHFTGQTEGLYSMKIALNYGESTAPLWARGVKGLSLIFKASIGVGGVARANDEKIDDMIPAADQAVRSKVS